MRRVVLGGLVLGCALIGGIRRADAIFASGDYDVAPVATGLSQPTAIAFLPDGRMVITGKTGQVWIDDGDTTTLVDDLEVCAGSEMGLLGIAIDPSFTTNQRIYLYRTEAEGGCSPGPSRNNQVVRATLGASSVSNIDVLLGNIRTDGGNHDGGGLRVGPDGKLWAAIGDTGIGDGGPPGTSTNPYSQNLDALEGKIVRLDLDGAIPADNPFVGQSGVRPEIYSYGLRNPFRFGFDPLTGIPWAGDVGQETVEEIDRILPGANYGWPQCEGHLPAPPCPLAGHTAPAHTYLHVGINGEAVTGGAFAEGGTLAGHHYFGDSVRSIVWHAELNAGRTGFEGTPDTVVSDAEGPVDFVFGPDGQLYFPAIESGTVYRVTHPGFGAGGSTTTTTAPPGSTTTTLPTACLDAPTVACVNAAIDALGDDLAAMPLTGKLRALPKFARRSASQVAKARPRSFRKATRLLEKIGARLILPKAVDSLPEAERLEAVNAVGAAIELVGALGAVLG